MTRKTNPSVRIGRGAPPPKTHEAYPFRQLKVGEFLLVKDETKWGYLRVRASKLGKSLDRTYTVRKEREGIRVYRTA